jgi:hypothetical protein
MKLTRMQLRKLIKETIGFRVNPEDRNKISGSVVITVYNTSSNQFVDATYDFYIHTLRLHGLKKLGDTASTTLNQVSDLFDGDGKDHMSSYLRRYYSHLLDDPSGNNSLISVSKLQSSYNFDPTSGETLSSDFDKIESLAKGLLKEAILGAGYTMDSKDYFENVTFKVYESDIDMEFDEGGNLIRSKTEKISDESLNPDFKREIGFRF